MQFDILTIFPNAFTSYFSESIIKRALDKKLISINISDIRDFGFGKWKKVDDTPYGGGPGMLMMVEPVYKTLKRIKRKKNSKVILFSPSGKKFDQKMAKDFSSLDQVIMICGHYEGIDSRIREFVDMEVSIGDYVLTNGNIPAMVLVDSVTRIIPGVLGNENSFIEDSFYSDFSEEYPQYTKPRKFKNLEVPPILLSGDHAKIEEWKKKMSK
jgi:tRNA (guanine37-N1)-methyltransferase